MSLTLLELKSIRLSFALRTVLDIPDFTVRTGDRIGLVGENGAGKTTLLRVICGALSPDEGSVRRLTPISYIQQMDEHGHVAVDDGQLESLFSVRPAADYLSGGERTRRRIASALSQKGALLLADEPTADLDREGVKRLERALLDYDGALLLVSHDRSLLDAICTQIAELEDGRLTLFPGNYAAYRAEKERRREHARFEYDQYRGEQTRLHAAIQGKREHAAQVGKLPTRMGNSEARLHKRSATEVEEKLHQTRRALQSRLAQLEVKERPREAPQIRMRLGDSSGMVSKTALEIRALTLRVPGRALLEGASMKLPTGTHTALLGPNGSGKTTLLTRIMQGNDPRIRLSPGVKAGWFGQDHQKLLDMDQTALENAMADAIHPESVVRSVLAQIGLKAEDVMKKVAVLSGGERGKVALARLFVSEINLLMLDEPTNHLDVYALEALEEVLTDYAGTLLLVSHDRKFVERVANRLVFIENQRLETFEGTLSEREKSLQTSPDDRQAQIDRITLELRMAELAARMSAPRKGDDPLKLHEEYDALALKKRALR